MGLFEEQKKKGKRTITVIILTSRDYPVLSLVRSKAPNQQLDLQVKGDR